jgi:hypothetical protein
MNLCRTFNGQELVRGRGRLLPGVRPRIPLRAFEWGWCTYTTRAVSFCLGDVFGMDGSRRIAGVKLKRQPKWLKSFRREAQMELVPGPLSGPGSCANTSIDVQSIWAAPRSRTAPARTRMSEYP